MTNSLSETKAFEKLTETLKEFKQEFGLHTPIEMVTEEWNVKDLLGHIVYWHGYYAENLAAEERGEKFVFENIKYSELNKIGVEALRKFSVEAMLKVLDDDHEKINKSVVGGKVKQMTYRQGTEPYTLLEFLKVVESHINGHIADLKKVGKLILV